MPDTAGAKPIALELRGLHCAACVAAVEGALQRVPGVASASVNLATGRAAVWLDPASIGDVVPRLIEAVRGAGYEAQLAAAVPRAGPAARQRYLRAHRNRLCAAFVLALPVLAGHVLPDASHPSWTVQAAFTLAVIGLAAGPMLAGAFRAAAARRANMDVLVSLGTLAALASSVIGGATQRPGLLEFDAAAMIVLFVSLGKYLEGRARGQTAAALEALWSRVPRTAERVGPEHVETVALEDVELGDRLRVAAHMTVPVDGEVVSGSADVNEAMLTGEAWPVRRAVGGRVLGGTSVVDGLIDIRATATGRTSAAARIAALVVEAQATKPPWQRRADRAAAVFVPLVMALALLTFAGWKWPGGAGTAWALERMIVVLVVACPCALGLAIPTAVLVGTTRAAERGILVRDAAALEAAGHLRIVLLDKTGTLTLGQPTLAQLESCGGHDDKRVLNLAAAAARLSPHPLARALVAAARERGVAISEVTDLQTQAGGGVRGRVDGRVVVVGNGTWLRENGVDVATHENRAAALAARGMSVVWVAVDGQVAGLLGLADTIHPESAAAVGALAALGVETRILSGDRSEAVRWVARELGVASFEAGLSPADKLARLRELMRGDGAVAMVGDGINDAPALAAADVGIAIGAGADVAREAADICLVGHSPRLIAEAVRISRASSRIMKQNLFWAVAYNAVMLPLAVWAPLPPALAAAAMMSSSLTVVGNALRLRRVI